MNNSYIQMQGHIQGHMQGHMQGQGQMHNQTQGQLQSHMQGQIQGQLQNQMQGQIQNQMQNQMQGQLQKHLQSHSHLQHQMQPQMQSQMKNQSQGQFVNPNLKQSQNKIQNIPKRDPQTLQQKFQTQGTIFSHSFDKFILSLPNLPKTMNTQAAVKATAKNYEELLHATDNLELHVRDFICRIVKKYVEQASNNATTDQLAMDAEQVALEDLFSLLSYK